MKILNIVLPICGLILTFYLTNLFLTSNFSYKGEAYYKGSGHLLEENFTKGILFIITRQLTVSTIIFYILFSALQGQARQVALKILIFFSIVIVLGLSYYTLTKLTEIMDGSYDRNYRILEIVLTWTLRLSGIFIGFWLTKKDLKFIRE